MDLSQHFPGGSDDKVPAYNAGDPGSIPGSGRSPREVNGNSLQYSCLGKPMDGEVWQATGQGVARVRHDLAINYHHYTEELSILYIIACIS